MFNWIKKYIKQLLFLILAIASAIFGMQKFAAKQSKRAATLDKENTLDSKKAAEMQAEAAINIARANDRLAEANSHMKKAAKIQKSLEKQLSEDTPITDGNGVEKWLNRPED